MSQKTKKTIVRIACLALAALMVLGTVYLTLSFIIG